MYILYSLKDSLISISKIEVRLLIASNVLQLLEILREL